MDSKQRVIRPAGELGMLTLTVHPWPWMSPQESTFCPRGGIIHSVLCCLNEILPS